MADYVLIMAPAIIIAAVITALYGRVYDAKGFNNSINLPLILLFVGWLFFREELTWNKLVGAGICLVGLFFINYKF